MIRRSSFILMGVLIFLAFVSQTTYLAATVPIRLELLAILVAVSAYRWEVRGGLLAGIWSGILASSLLPVSPLKVVFLYATFGFIAALLFDTTLSDRPRRRAMLSVALSAAFFIFEGALFASKGMSVVPPLALDVVLLNAGLMFLLMQSAAWLPLDSQSNKLGRGHDLVRGIVA